MVLWKRGRSKISLRVGFFQIIVGCLGFFFLNNWKKIVDTETGKASGRFVGGRGRGDGKESLFSFQCYF